MNREQIEKNYPIADILGISYETIVSEMEPLKIAFIKDYEAGNLPTDGHVVKFISDFPNVRPLLKLWFLMSIINASLKCLK